MAPHGKWIFTYRDGEKNSLTTEGLGHEQLTEVQIFSLIQFWAV